jgi:hypothetical protein
LKKWCLLIVLFIPTFLWADITLPWSSSYANLSADWTATNANSWGVIPGGDGLWQNYNSTSTAHHEQITALANYSGGAGGRGQRHYLGTTNDSESEGCVLYFTPGVRELWIRWYMRFETGLQFVDEAGCKILYFKTPSGSNLNPLLIGHDVTGITYSVNADAGDGLNYWANNFSLHDIFNGSDSSDGSWHCYELHIKSETTTSPPNGEVDLWIDSVSRMHYTNVNHGIWAGGTYIGGVSLGDNAHGVLTQERYIDFDDFVVQSTTPSKRDSSGRAMIGTLSDGGGAESVTYTLNASVVSGHGTITTSPTTALYAQGTVVSLTAAPESGYQVKAWTGTDNDTSKDTTNTVTMNAIHLVTVEFDPASNAEEEKSSGGWGCFISTSASDRPKPLIHLLTFLGIGLICIVRIKNVYKQKVY